MAGRISCKPDIWVSWLSLNHRLHQEIALLQEELRIKAARMSVDL